MKRFTATLLALGLAAAVGTASAQTYGTPYGQPDYRSSPGIGQNGGAYYDYARVLRVDPVINSGYGSYPASGSQRCYTRNDGYAGNDGYYPDNGNGYYGNSGYGNSGYSNSSYGNDGYYGNQSGYGSNTGRTMATVIGGVLGAAIGSQVGGGSARYATSAIGSMVGGMAGRQVYENAQRQRQPLRTASVTVCDPVPADGRYYGTATGSVSAYDVTYEYGGRNYTTRTSYNPGSRIRVRVDVRPE
jgi:uncharacterized protein YcfJ